MTLLLPMPGGPGGVDAADPAEGRICCFDIFSRSGDVEERVPGGGGDKVDGSGAGFAEMGAGGGGRALTLILRMPGGP